MASGKSDLIDIAVDLKHETDKAWLVDPGTGLPIWVARSVAELEPSKAGGFILTMPEWMAEQKGLV